MKHCDACGVKLDPAYTRCPLCHKDIGEPEGELPFPKVEKAPRQTKKALTKKVKGLLALTILCVGICVLINFILWKGTLWSLLVVASSLYVWVLMAITVLYPWQFGSKVLLQLAGISALLIAIEAITPQKIWAQDLVIPFLIVTAIILEIYNVYINRKRWRENMVFLIIAILIGFIPLILYGAGVIALWWPAALCAFFSVFTFIGFILFAVKQFKNEMTKRFHL